MKLQAQLRKSGSMVVMEICRGRLASHKRRHVNILATAPYRLLGCVPYNFMHGFEISLI